MPASAAGIGRHNTNISSPPVSEVGAELLALLQAALDGSGAHGAKAVIGVACVLLGARFPLGHLDEVGTTLDSVDEDEARRELVAAPAAVHVGNAATRGAIILGVDIEVGNLADGVTGRVRGDGRDVVDAEARHVVGLIDQVAADVLVVVNCRGGA